jgi:predicted ATPase
MSFTLHVENLRALRAIQWAPDGVCCLVGPNGSGKTTSLLVLELLRAALDRDLPTAIVNVLGGSSGLRHRGAAEDEPVELGLDVGSLSWRIRLAVQGASVDPFAAETVHDGGELPSLPM